MVVTAINRYRLHLLFFIFCQTSILLPIFFINACQRLFLELIPFTLFLYFLLIEFSFIICSLIFYRRNNDWCTMVSFFTKFIIDTKFSQFHSFRKRLARSITDPRQYPFYFDFSKILVLKNFLRSYSITGSVFKHKFQ